MRIQKLVFALAISLALANCQSESTSNQNERLIAAELAKQDSLLKDQKRLKERIAENDSILDFEMKRNRKLKEALRNLQKIENEDYQISNDTFTHFSVSPGGWEIVGGRSYSYWSDPCCCPRFEPGIYPTPGGSRGLSIAPGQTVTLEIPFDLSGLIKPDSMPADTTQHEN